MTLPSTYKINFDIYAKELVEQALSRMLSQHYDKCVLRQFVAAFIEECNELYDACIELQKQRTLFYAAGENLNALGRIVGEQRTPWSYDESSWFFFDRQGQSYDQANMWCLYSNVGVSVPVQDPQYRSNIAIKAVKNHTLTSSIPELHYLIDLSFGVSVTFEKTGPNQVRLIVPASISMTQLILLSKANDDEQVDNRFYMNYPATLDISEVIMFAPENWFMFDTYTSEEDVIVEYENFMGFDRENQQWDFAPMWRIGAAIDAVYSKVKISERAWDVAPVAVGVTQIGARI